MPLGYGNFSIPLAIDILLDRPTSSEKICEKGIIRLNCDTVVTQLPAEGWLSFMKQDTADLEEFKFELNPEEIDLESTQNTHNALFSNSVFYDVQKLMIQEKGEDKYYAIYNKKKEQQQMELDSYNCQQEMIEKVNHASVGRQLEDHSRRKIKA